MFHLPAFTTVMLVGVPAFWILYTVVFMWLSRGWAREDVESRNEN
jgi:hypothetical protein